MSHVDDNLRKAAGNPENWASMSYGEKKSAARKALAGSGVKVRDILAGKEAPSSVPSKVEPDEKPKVPISFKATKKAKKKATKKAKKKK
jgi:hypothetical protein